MTPISMPGRKRRRRARRQDWPALGIKHLAQEIVALGSNQRYAIQSPLERLLVHLLKYRDDPAQRPRGSWHLTIRHARREVTKHLGDSSSLGDHPTRYLDTAYRHARADAPNATSLSLVSFPETCPWPLAEVLAEDWWPEA